MLDWTTAGCRSRGLAALLLLVCACGGGAAPDGGPAASDGSLAQDAAAADAAPTDASAVTPTDGSAVDLDAWAPSGPVYYVALAGSDSNSGLSRDQAWRTLAHAAETLVAGDTVVVLAGTYYSDPITAAQVHITQSGTTGAPITYQTEGDVHIAGFVIDADYITIKGFHITTLMDGAVGILAHSAGHCEIQDNDIRYCTMGGIVLTGSPAQPAATHDCVVRNNRFYRNGMYAIEVRGQNHLIEGNEAWGTIQHHPCNVSNATVSWLDADAFRFHGPGHVFRNNHVHDILYGPAGWTQGAACSIASLDDPTHDFNDDPHIDCFQTYSASDKQAGSGTLFEQNLCENWDHDASAGVMAKGFQIAGGGGGITIRNNIVRSNLLAIVTDSDDLLVANNTFVGSVMPNSQGIYLNTSANGTIENNIFAYQDNGGSIWPDAVSAMSLAADYNCVFAGAGQTASGTPSPHDLWGVDPGFVDETAGDFHLRSNSPLINAGTTIPSVTNDFEGHARPLGGAYDIGAYEAR